MLKPKTVFDALTTYCPALGHNISFDYCRQATSGLPCRRALVCWERHFPVDRYMAAVLTKDEWQSTFAGPPPDKWTSILRALDAVTPDVEGK